MMVFQSKAATVYGYDSDKGRKVVTVSAQWNEYKQFRLIVVAGDQIGRVFSPPSCGKEREYFCNVFNLVAKTGLSLTVTPERLQ